MLIGIKPAHSDCLRFVLDGVAFRGLSDKSRLQVFSYTADKEIRTDDLCLDVSRLNGPVVMLKCHHMKGNQMFEYDAEVRSVFPGVADLRPGSWLQMAGVVTMALMKC